MPRWASIAIVFAASFLSLAYRVPSTPLADGYVDTVGRIAAQDEAVYAHVALQMAVDGQWLTPKFMGRPVLFKPPLLYWASAASVRIFGNTVFALRFPSLVAGAAVAALLYAWLGGWAGVAAALLLLSDPLWHTVSRLVLTDALLALFTVAAVHGAARSSLAQFASATAGALLTKGIAGFIPMMALGVWWITSPRAERWPIRRLALWMASPWPPFLVWALTQWSLQPRWFWTEFVEVEILGYSLGTPPQTSAESPLWFYLRRLTLTDAPLLLALPAALPLWRKAASRIWFALVVAVAAAAGANQYRNIAYVLPAIPALCLLAAQATAKRARMIAAIAAVAMLVRIAQPQQPWGLRYQPSGSIAVAPALRDYAKVGRPNDLLIVDPEDEFLATTLGLPKVRYVYFGGAESYQRYGLDFRHLGIAVTLDEWRRLPALTPLYQERLRAWGWNSPDPIASVILLRDASELPRLIESSPDADFLLRRRMPAPAHEIRELEGGRVFLYAQGGPADALGANR
jgi:hypothetical protein